MRVAVIVAGVMLSLGSLVVSGLYTLIIGFGCSGTDAGEPPSADSIGHTLCDSPALPVGLVVLGLGAAVAPIWGGAIAARRRGYAPLLGSAAVAAGAVSGLALITHAVEEGTENVALIVGAPVLVCVCLVVIAFRRAASSESTNLPSMPILDERVERYIHHLRPPRSEVVAEMEAVAQRDSVPIVYWETGRFLATLCRALDPNVLEVGTAIGYSTLHLAEQLSSGRVVTLEIDPDLARQARDFWARAGVADRIELVERDARDTIPSLSGPFDLRVVDAAKGQYREYIELAEPLLSERAVLVIDNLLVGGEVALPEGAEGRGSAESIASARTLNPTLLGSENWLGSVLPIGDGVGFAARL